MEAAVRCFKISLITLALGPFLTACGRIGGEASAPSNPGIGGTVANPSTEMYKPAPLLWESQNKDGMLWSAYAYQIIGNDVANELLPGTDDIKNFCPNYANLSAPEKVNFWAYLVSAIVKYASGFDPAARVRDVTRGMDAITGAPAFAEGLLHLGYQDVRTYAFCAFDWDHDKNLPITDIARTILDPVKNLDCGIKILATQIEKTKKIALTSGTYWSFLKATGSGSKIKEIQKDTSELPFCVAH